MRRQVGTNQSLVEDVQTLAIIRAAGAGRMVLVCEHASNTMPPAYHGLGLKADVLASHIAWDPGALGVALGLSELMDAPLVAQNVSRLIYDCNRPPESEGAMPAHSEIYDIPGNKSLSLAEREARVQLYYRPFQAAVRGLIADRLARRLVPFFATIHSFTPVYNYERRTVEVGILYDADTRLAELLIASMQAEGRFDVQRNVPYGPADGVTHTLVEQALPHKLPNVMVEIRNDLIATPGSQRAMAEWLFSHLSAAMGVLETGSGNQRVQH